ncbi:hypothetical protein [Rhodococcus sp. NPDC060176]|uniref:hypothetical protein n=1 Tax=Rhodococcus sp. NPDC060176 TaxID=3347062 RepID=UPI00366529A5
MSGRMIFPYEELPEDERGEFTYQEVFHAATEQFEVAGYSPEPVFPDDPWMQAVYDGTFARFAKVKAESKLVGCPVVMDFKDGRRSIGTIAGIGDVKYDHGELLSYVLTVQEFPRYSPPATRKRVVHRASRGLRPPQSSESHYRSWLEQVLELRAVR